MKKWLGVVALVFSLVVLVGGIYLVQRPREIKKSAAAAASQISITPTELTKSKDDSFSVNVDIDTGENTVSAADIEVDYDATKLEGVSITAGSYLPVVLVGGKIENGKATIILGSQPSEPKQGTGTLATINFKVLGDNTTTQIAVSENTQVTAIGEDGNVLTTRNPSNITIGAPSTEAPSPTPFTGEGCIRTGCSEEVCSDTSKITACNYLPEFACYQTARCEKQSDGTCGWSPTEELQSCLANPSTPPTTPPTEPPTAPPTQPPSSGTGGTVSGDINEDGVVNLIDIGILIDNYDSTTPSNLKADVNSDGVVNLIDIGILIDNYQ